MAPLVEHELFGVRDKVEIATERIRAFAPPEGYWLAYSGGKDSTVILDLARKSGVLFEAHYSMTTIDPPELVRFIRTQGVCMDHPPKSFLTVLQTYGMPLRRTRWCCKYYKERGGDGRFVMTGVRWEESFKRGGRQMVEVCKTKPSRRFLHPIIDWTSEDVWEYIRSRGIEYCRLYDEGFDRIGCIFCPFAGTENRKRHAIRWPGYARSFERAFIRLHQKRKLEGNPSVDRWKDGHEMFQWWLLDPGPKDDPGQCSLFDG